MTNDPPVISISTTYANTLNNISRYRLFWPRLYIILFKKTKCHFHVGKTKKKGVEGVRFAEEEANGSSMAVFFFIWLCTFSTLIDGLLICLSKHIPSEILSKFLMNLKLYLNWSKFYANFMFFDQVNRTCKFMHMFLFSYYIFKQESCF